MKFDEFVKIQSLGDNVKSSRCKEKRANAWLREADRLFILFLRASSPAPLERMQVIST